MPIVVGAEWKVEGEQRERERERTRRRIRERLVAESGRGVMNHIGPCRYREDFRFCGGRWGAMMGSMR